MDMDWRWYWVAGTTSLSSASAAAGAWLGRAKPIQEVRKLTLEIEKARLEIKGLERSEAQEEQRIVRPSDDQVDRFGKTAPAESREFRMAAKHLASARILLGAAALVFIAGLGTFGVWMRREPEPLVTSPPITLPGTEGAALVARFYRSAFEDVRSCVTGELDRAGSEGKPDGAVIRRCLDRSPILSIGPSSATTPDAMELKRQLDLLVAKEGERADERSVVRSCFAKQLLVRPMPSTEEMIGRCLYERRSE